MRTALGCLLLLLASCSQPAPEAKPPSEPLFQVGERKYFLSHDEPGVISDEAALYWIDGGERHFRYGDRALETQRYVSTHERFDQLTPAKRSEFVSVAEAGIRFIDGRQGSGQLDSQHRKVLADFLASVSSR